MKKTCIDRRCWRWWGSYRWGLRCILRLVEFVPTNRWSSMLCGKLAFELGMCAHVTKAWPSAYVYFTKAAELYERTDEALFRSGYAAENREQFTLAFQQYLECLEVPGEKQLHWYYRASYTAERLLKFDQAVEIALKGLEVRADDKSLLRVILRIRFYFSNEVVRNSFELGRFTDNILNYNENNNRISLAWLTQALINSVRSRKDLARYIFNEFDNPRVGLAVSQVKEWKPRIVYSQNYLPSQLTQHIGELPMEDLTQHLDLNKFKSWLYLYAQLIRSGHVKLAYKLRDIGLSRFFNPQNPPDKLESFSDWVHQGAALKRFNEVLPELISRLKSNKIPPKERDSMIMLACDVSQQMGSLTTSRRIFEEFKPSWTISNTYREFSALLKGKRVAIVGPASNTLFSGDEIDKFDVVVRTNYLGNDWLQPKRKHLGSFCTISYYNVENFRGNVRNLIQAANCSDLGFSVVKRDYDKQLFKVNCKSVCVRTNPFPI